MEAHSLQSDNFHFLFFTILGLAQRPHTFENLIKENQACEFHNLSSCDCVIDSTRMAIDLFQGFIYLASFGSPLEI